MSSLSDTTNNLYSLYVKSITDLAQSIVIKFDQVAQATNQVVLQNTGVLTDPNDRTQWKYYQNISGIYHISDTQMYVRSLDSDTYVLPISFTVASLATNPVTKAAYAYGSSFYNELLSAYPTQEMLILGILYPCDMSLAIDAKDGTILSYPTFLVESQELDFISNLQAWVYAYVDRWIVKAFTLTDNLYPATYLAQLYLSLIGAIMNIRLAACKTNQTHSFHVTQYLRSHGFLDAYLNELNSVQALNMYRNINYYERYAGFSSTFTTLVDVLLTKAGFPVYEYVMQHNVEALSHSTVTDTENIAPTALFKRNPINSIAQRYPLIDYNLSEVMAAMSLSLPSYEIYPSAAEEAIEEQIELYVKDFDTPNSQEAIEDKLDLSINAQLSTKVIECTLNPVFKYTEQIPVDILFNQWIAFVANNKYSVPVEYTIIGSSSAINMNHQQALAVWIYAMSKALEPIASQISDPYGAFVNGLFNETPRSTYTALTRIPKILASRIVVDPKPNQSVLLGMVDSAVVSAADIAQIYSTAVTIPNTISSLVEFTSICVSIYSARLEQYRLYSYQSNPLARAQCQGAVDSLYCDNLVTLSDDGMLYSTLFSSLGLNISTYQPIDYFNMANSIFDYATGATTGSNNSPTTIQASMVKLLTYLSSYSIHVVNSGNSTETISLEHPDVRVFNVINNESAAVLVDEEFTRVLSTEFTEEASGFIIIKPIVDSSSFIETETSYTSLSSNEMSSYGSNDETYGNINIGLTVSNTFDQQALFNSLTSLQRSTVVDFYRLSN